MKRVVHFVQAFVPMCLLFVSSHTFSQSITTGSGKFEVGLALGPSFFVGDLGGSAGVGKTFIKDLDLPLTELSKGIYASYYPAEWLGFRASFNYLGLKGDDAQAPNKGGAEEDRLHRNLSFKTNVAEGSLMAEFYPTVFIEQFDGLQGKLRPYAVIGAGVYHFNPKAKDTNGDWVALQPLHLEGQGFAEYPKSKPYSLTQFEVPMGFGFKYYLKENMFVGLEVLHRKLFTDYVDDVSQNYYIDPIYFDQYLTPANAAIAKRLYYRGTYQSAQTNPGNIQTFQRGDPTKNDAYFTTVIRLGWRLNDANSASGRAVRQLRCPSFY